VISTLVHFTSIQIGLWLVSYNYPTDEGRRDGNSTQYERNR